MSGKALLKSVLLSHTYPRNLDVTDEVALAVATIGPMVPTGCTGGYTGLFVTNSTVGHARTTSVITHIAESLTVKERRMTVTAGKRTVLAHRQWHGGKIYIVVWELPARWSATMLANLCTDIVEDEGSGSTGSSRSDVSTVSSGVLQTEGAGRGSEVDS